MSIFKKKKNSPGQTLEKAYQMVYEDLVNSGDPKLKGIFDPSAEDDTSMYGIMYIMNNMALIGHYSDSEKGKEKVKAFTNNMLNCYTERNFVPRGKFDDIEQEIFIDRLRRAKDDVLSYFADEIENDGVTIRMSNRHILKEIATGKREYIKKNTVNAADTITNAANTITNAKG